MEGIIGKIKKRKERFHQFLLLLTKYLYKELSLFIFSVAFVIKCYC